MNKEELVKVSTYARQKGVSLQTVYNWIYWRKVKSKEIDGMKFVVVKHE